MISSLGCGSAEKKPTPTSLTETEIESIIEEGCNPVTEKYSFDPSHIEWVCNEEALLAVGELGIRLQEKVLDFKDEEAYYDKKLGLTEDFYEAKLDQWYRTWYITIPLGFLAGGIFSLTLALAL